MPVVFIDNSPRVLAQMGANKKKALAAAGVKAVNLTLWQMRQGYGKPIRITGDLQRDVHAVVGFAGEDTVSVGNSLEYAPFVHEGTYKMKGRPYLRDGLLARDHPEQLQKAVEEEVKEGF